MNKITHDSKRIYITNDTSPKNKASSIRRYNKLVGFVLSIIGMSTKVHVYNKSHYINNKSFAKLMIRFDGFDKTDKKFHSVAGRLNLICQKLLNIGYDKAAVKEKIERLKPNSVMEISNLINDLVSKKGVKELKNDCREQLNILIKSKGISDELSKETGEIRYIDQMEAAVKNLNLKSELKEFAPTGDRYITISNLIDEKGPCILITEHGDSYCFWKENGLICDNIPTKINSDILEFKLSFQVDGENKLP